MKLTMIQTLSNVESLQKATSDWRNQGMRIALVPTMGALHAGHIDLVTAAKHHADKVVASIFINPTQFALHEDLSRYPRTQAADIEMLNDAGCDGVYIPDVSAIYPNGFSTTVNVAGVSERWEGRFRPHFFAGVTTVVAKLLIQSQPDVAMFGEKDWQQLQVVSKLVKDLDLGVEIVGVTTRREPDGLAMSSRNAYLTVDQRKLAPALKQAMDNIVNGLASDADNKEALVRDANVFLLNSGFAAIDYLEPCHAQTLEPWKAGDPLRVLAAAWLGNTRLIDNRGA